MIDKYKKNKEKYEKLIHYVNNKSNIPEDIRKNMIEIMERYRISISCMEESEMYELIEQCIKYNNERPLKKELHSVIFGNTSIENSIVYHNERDGEIEDYLY